MGTHTFAWVNVYQSRHPDGYLRFGIRDFDDCVILANLTLTELFDYCQRHNLKPRWTD